MSCNRFSALINSIPCLGKIGIPVALSCLSGEGDLCLDANGALLRFADPDGFRNTHLTEAIREPLLRTEQT
jgi:hypothetical protein